MTDTYLMCYLILRVRMQVKISQLYIIPFVFTWSLPWHKGGIKSVIQIQFQIRIEITSYNRHSLFLTKTFYCHSCNNCCRRDKKKNNIYLITNLWNPKHVYKTLIVALDKPLNTFDKKKSICFLFQQQHTSYERKS